MVLCKKVDILPWNSISFDGTTDEDHFVRRVLQDGRFQVSRPEFGHIPPPFLDEIMGEYSKIIDIFWESRNLL